MNMMSFNQFVSESDIDATFNHAKNYISEHNKTDNAYHNNKHMIDVFNNAMTLFNEYKDEFNLTPDDKLHLGLAALFHDFNHSGGKLKDSENIELALTALREYLDTVDKSKMPFQHPLISDSYTKIKWIIMATEFPHNDINPDILQKIIRDADTMGGITGDWMSVVKSLATELNKSLEEFVPAQIKFLQSVKYNTDYCNQLLADNKESIIRELEQIL